MSTAIFGAHVVSGPPAPEWLAKPEYRRATINMVLGAQLFEPLLRDLRAAHPEVLSEDIGLVLQSQTGELEATVEFLRGWSQMGIARPLLFQSSLHNATAGFLAIQYAIKGPVISTSPSFFSEEQALEMAQVLLDEKQCRFCLVVSLDAWPAIKGLEGGSGFSASYASAVVLAREPGGLGRRLNSIEMKPEARPVFAEPQWSHRPSSRNALFNLASALLSSETQKVETQKEEGRSVITWSGA